MKKWYAEEYAWEIEVIGFMHGNSTVRYCRNGEEIGDKVYLYLWMSCKRRRGRYLFQVHDVNVSNYGGS